MAGEDKGYSDWLKRRRRCAWCGREGAIVVHHSTHHSGMGQRAHDHDAIPLCAACHQDFHDATGRFKGMPKRERLDWQDKMVERYQKEFDVSQEEDW